MTRSRPDLRAAAIILAWFLFIGTVALLAGCAATKPRNDAPGPVAATPDVYTKPDSVNTSPEPVRAVYTKPALLTRLFSSPEGSARRQQRKLARAQVPRKLGKGAVYAPQAREVVSSYKPRAPVIKADSGAAVTAIGKAKAPVASAPGATATATESTGLSWWLLLLPAAGLAFWLYRKTIPFA